jgi:hypothetical protein
MLFFTSSILSLCFILSLVQADTALAADDSRRTIVGYSSELSVRAGDKIDFKVNSTGGERYDALLPRKVLSNHAPWKRRA